VPSSYYGKMNLHDVPINLSEWPYTEFDVQLQAKLRSLMQVVETKNSISLDRLEGISVVENLTGALAAFEAGYPSDNAAAMRDTVLGRMITTQRGDRVQGHIFFPIDAAFQLVGINAPHYSMCVYMFIHECAHVQELDTRARSWTNDELLNPPLAQPIALTHQIVWNEYAACRLSAFSGLERIEDFKEMLRQSVEALQTSRSEPRSAFAPTQEGRTRALTLALNLSLPVLQAYAYLFGHCRGAKVSFADSIPENFVTLLIEQPMRDAFSVLEQELDSLWDSRNHWPGYDAFLPLARSNCVLIKVLTGILMTPAPQRQMGVALAA
jgi:hypothetical protein